MASSKSADVKAGALFVAFGVFFGAYTLRTLDLGSLIEMGPGFFPLCLCALLTILGVAIVLKAQPVEGSLPQVNWRAAMLVTAAPVAFGFTVRSVGLLPALAAAVLLAVVAGKSVGWLRASLIVAGVTMFCVAVFKWGLDVPFDLVNPALLG